MADDGMLLNFNLTEAPLVQKPKLTGGSWRARRAAQKFAAFGPRKKRLFEELPAKSAEKEELIIPEAPALKRRRIDNVSQPKFAPHTKTTSKLSRDHASNGSDRQVISSLFSYNPESKIKPDAPKQNESETPIQASNAPLSGELESFTSLGLTTSLAAHLTQKLGVKKPTAIQKAAIAQLIHEDADAFIQAETGSGKTLAYLLPIVQRIMELSRPGTASKVSSEKDAAQEQVHRDSGLFAIVLAPTRELVKQISTVLDSLLRCANWIVSGIVTGGEKKKSEKARLRKGLNILIATPGRLADHLSHTEALDVSCVRWLVLDEGDRLVELGFEDDIKKIIGCLNIRWKAGQKSNGSLRKVLPDKRSTVLCSATMKMDVQRLGEISLKNAKYIQSDATEEKCQQVKEKDFTAPAQLKQSYAVVPAKLRLVTLMALLRQSFMRKGAVNKAIVFISCADSVDFHFDIFTRLPETEADPANRKNKLNPTTTPTVEPSVPKQDPSTITTAPSPCLSATTTTTPQPETVHVSRLHGSLPQHLRTSTLRTFHRSPHPSVLFCTDVASRGLDLPNVDLVVEYDAAFSREDHLHRVGRTARAGRDGRAVVFLMPGSEEGYVEVLGRDRGSEAQGIGMKRVEAAEILKKGLVGMSSSSAGVATSTLPTSDKHKQSQSQIPTWEDEATDWQLDVERWVLADHKVLEKARKAYISHVRAYATHVVTERQYFDIKELHLGHLAKAFGLRDRPGNMRVPGGSTARGASGTGAKSRRAGRGAAGAGKRGGAEGGGGDDGERNEQEAAVKMRKMVRNKKMMMGGGADEFNLG